MESIGPYRLDSELGHGAMGVVFRGFDPAIGRAVAIKIIRLDQFVTANEKAELRLRFAREATAAGKLSHPNIVTVYHLGEQGDVQYLVLELVEGWSLEKALSNGLPQDRAASISILSQVAAALDYAHCEGIVHRDVKPANILVRRDGMVKSTDFGIARISSQTITKTGFSMGTPAYMAPEQIMSARVSGRADQFSLAVIAYQMLSGRRPFAADTDPALIFKIVPKRRSRCTNWPRHSRRALPTCWRKAWRRTRIDVLPPAQNSSRVSRIRWRGRRCRRCQCRYRFPLQERQKPSPPEPVSTGRSAG